MAAKKSNYNADRYLLIRAGNFHYKRRIPTSVIAMDDRGEFAQQSLKTSDLAEARAKRDILERADDEYWAALILGGDCERAIDKYNQARKRVEALGFTYRHPAEISTEQVDTILRRIETVLNDQMPKPVVQAVLGGVKKPAMSVQKAFELYRDEIAAHEIAGKSPAQRKKWEKVKQLAVDYFTQVVGQRAIDEISREDAQKFYRYWIDRVAPAKGVATHSASMGNRVIGNMRVLYDAYFKYLGDDGRVNPFANLSFNERQKNTRPPFETEWIRDVIMKPGALANMNDQGRGVILAMIETGARPSELCNLTAAEIVLDHDVPHLKIAPRFDPDDKREIKTQSSIRDVPLVGVALEVFKKHPNGFPRYKDRESSMSAALNKYLREHGLLPSEKHKVYSFRHSFEDRMKEAGIDSELRRILMGHTVDRPTYGSGGALKWRQQELLKIQLPFEPSIV
ncbi:DUF6538 domain-containing protein [Paenochrobactrum pullorum]|uniref:DUF6538 domain-containing protein n=1 Tax=Paenochrobactrum pullorum TaxID=1324351 RepID=UPI0035BBA058